MKDLIINKSNNEKYSRKSILRIFSNYDLEVVEITDHFKEKEMKILPIFC